MRALTRAAGIKPTITRVLRRRPPDAAASWLPASACSSRVVWCRLTPPSRRAAGAGPPARRRAAVAARAVAAAVVAVPPRAAPRPVVPRAPAAARVAPAVRAVVPGAGPPDPPPTPPRARVFPRPARTARPASAGARAAADPHLIGELRSDDITSGPLGRCRLAAVLRPVGHDERHAAARHAAGQADAGEVGADDPDRRPVLRAQVGRLPLHRLPRRRRGRDRQPQREADDPLLPRGGRGGQGATCPSGACSTARSSSSVGRPARVRGAAAAHPPGGQPGHQLSPETPARFVAFDLLALGDDDYTDAPVRGAPGRAGGGAGRRRGADPPDARSPGDRDAGAGLVHRSSRAPGWTGWSPSRWPAPTSRTSGSCSRSSTSAPRTAWSPATACTRAAPDSIGSLLLGLYDDERHARLRRRDRRLPGGPAQGAVRRAAAAGHHVRRPPVGLGRSEEEGQPDPAQRRGQPLEQRQGPVLHPALDPSSWSRSATSTWRASGSGTPPSSTAGGPTATRARAPTSSSRSRSRTTWPTSSRAATGSDFTTGVRSLTAPAPG